MEYIYQPGFDFDDYSGYQGIYCNRMAFHSKVHEGWDGVGGGVVSVLVEGHVVPLKEDQHLAMVPVSLIGDEDEDEENDEHVCPDELPGLGTAYMLSGDDVGDFEDFEEFEEFEEFEDFEEFEEFEDFLYNNEGVREDDEEYDADYEDNDELDDEMHSEETDFEDDSDYDEAQEYIEDDYDEDESEEYVSSEEWELADYHDADEPENALAIEVESDSETETETESESDYDTEPDLESDGIEDVNTAVAEEEGQTQGEVTWDSDTTKVSSGEEGDTPETSPETLMSPVELGNDIEFDTFYHQLKALYPQSSNLDDIIDTPPGVQLELLPMTLDKLNFLYTFKTVVPRNRTIRNVQELQQAVERNRLSLQDQTDNYRDCFCQQNLLRMYGAPVRELGTGFSATTYLFQNLHQRLFAIKMVKLEETLSLELVCQEFFNTQGLDSQYVCKSWDILASRYSPHNLVLVQEYFSGSDLASVFHSPVTISPFLGRVLARKLAAAVHHCHLAGISHNDLKPENIMVNLANMEVRLIDFGHSYTTNQPPTTQAINKCYLWGTEGYMPPYFVSKGLIKTIFSRDPGMRRIAQAKDIWSLACVIFSLETNGETLWEQCSHSDHRYMAYRETGRLISFDKVFFGQRSEGSDDLAWILYGMTAIKEHERMTLADLMQTRWYTIDYFV